MGQRRTRLAVIRLCIAPEVPDCERLQLRLAWTGPGHLRHSVPNYLLVDDRDGRILAELASAGQAARLLGRLERTAPVRLWRVDHRQNELTEVTSVVSARPLPPLMARPARRRR
jgi:hypothetical protein